MERERDRKLLLYSTYHAAVQPGLMPALCERCYTKTLNCFFNVCPFLEIGAPERDLSHSILSPLGAGIYKGVALLSDCVHHLTFLFPDQ